MNELEKEMITEAFKSANTAVIHDRKSKEVYICLVPGYTPEDLHNNMKCIELIVADIDDFKKEVGIEEIYKMDDLPLFLNNFIYPTAYTPLEEIGNPHPPKKPNAVYIPPHIAKRQKRQKGKGLHF